MSSVPAALVVRARPVFFFFFYGFAFSKQVRIKTWRSVQDILKMYRRGGEIMWKGRSHGFFFGGGGTDEDQSSPSEYRQGLQNIDCQSTANEGEGSEENCRALMGEQVNFTVIQTEIPEWNSAIGCMCLLSFTVSHLNFNTTYASSVKFQMEIQIICRRGFRSQTTPILVISCCFYCKGRLRDVQ